MTQLHRESYGRGATSVRTVVGRDRVITFLEDILTPLERTLIEAGEVDPKVRAFLSQVRFDPDVAVEIFLLEPDPKRERLALSVGRREADRPVLLDRFAALAESGSWEAAARRGGSLSSLRAVRAGRARSRIQEAQASASHVLQTLVEEADQ